MRSAHVPMSSIAGGDDVHRLRTRAMQLIHHWDVVTPRRASGDIAMLPL
jgi:hypothetical protein